ncbi:MAG: hypothetical protein AB7N91_31155, partial [Candidatus Tectimicrobiota bacterium]
MPDDRESSNTKFGACGVGAAQNSRRGRWAKGGPTTTAMAEHGTGADRGLAPLTPGGSPWAFGACGVGAAQRLQAGRVDPGGPTTTAPAEPRTGADREKQMLFP